MASKDFSHILQQRTLASPIAYVGIGAQKRARVTLRVLPAEAGHGITFDRCDLPPEESAFTADWAQVVGTSPSTTLGNRFGHRIANVEHLLSALNGLGIDNADIQLDGPEIPFMEGSAFPFASAFLKAGIQSLEAPREAIVVSRPVRLQQGQSWAELLPDTARRITVSLGCSQVGSGAQSLSFCLSPANYARELASARTSRFAQDLAQLRTSRLARGRSIGHAEPVEDGLAVNREGLGQPDAFVRHKVLEAVGDLCLAGAPIIGHYRAHRPGHRLNTDLIRLLFSDPESWFRVPTQDLLTGEARDVKGATGGMTEQQDGSAASCANPRTASGW